MLPTGSRVCWFSTNGFFEKKEESMKNWNVALAAAAALVRVAGFGNAAAVSPPAVPMTEQKLGADGLPLPGNCLR